jgi:hypothetical protein
MKTLDEFRAFYEEELLSEIPNIQNEIEEIKSSGFEDNSQKWSKVGVFVVATLFFFLPLAFIIGPSTTSLVVAAAGGYWIQSIATAVGETAHKDAKMEELIKEEIGGRIVRFFGDDFSLDPLEEIDKDRINESLIFPVAAEGNFGEDYVHGTVGETRVEFSEVVLSSNPFAKEVRGIFFTEAQRRHAEKVEGYTMDKLADEKNSFFRGLYFIADFPKQFRGHTLVRPTDFGSYDPDDRLGTTRPPMERVHLEDPELETLYNVYGTDQQQARYILSTSMMERVKRFRNRTGKPVFFAFYDSNMHVAIPYDRDLLELETRLITEIDPESVLDRKHIFDYFKDLTFILDIVEEFNLNTQIWLTS